MMPSVLADHFTYSLILKTFKIVKLKKKGIICVPISFTPVQSKWAVTNYDPVLMLFVQHRYMCILRVSYQTDI